MANTKSALKAIRATEKKTIINLKRKKAYKDARKDVLKAVAANDKAAAEKLLPTAYKAIDKAAKNNAIHANAAARYKSRLTAKVNTLG